ncbi:MAG: chaperonin GroEL, partial [Chlamydiia bacterium]|nr:chaperonin GroEL [Chlamydiia bacterium]
EIGLERLFQNLDQMAFPIHTMDDVQKIATISASGDSEIGSAIRSCFEKVGKEGVIVIEEGKGTQTEIEWVQGIEVDRGYVSAYFCTNQDRMRVEMEDPYLLIADQKISSAQDLLPLVQQVNAMGGSLLIIAESLEGDALSTLVLNKLRGILKVAAIQSPSFGDKRRLFLEDLAVLTGAEVISEGKGLSLKEATIAQLGRAEKVLAYKEKTVIVGGKGEQKKIESRVLHFENEMQTIESFLKKQELQKRKAIFLGGAAFIRVGAMTDSEMKRKKQIFEDALHSTRAACAGGVVPGGGVALLRAAKALEQEECLKEEKVGFDLFLRACFSPFRQIVLNAGWDPSLMMNEVLAKESSYGFNAVTEKIEDFSISGILDPVKGVKVSLAHAVSMAGIVFLSEVLIEL